MDIAKLKTFDISFPLSHGQFFFDLGYVDSIPQTHRKIYKIQGYSDEELSKDSDTKAVGKHLGFRDEELRHSYIFYKKMDLKEADILVRSHEEVHALNFFGGLYRLSEKILKASGVYIDFLDFDDVEERAHFGSLYCLRFMNKMSDEKITYYYDLDMVNSLNEKYVELFGN